MIARFTVYGISQPQGSKSAYIRGGRAVIVEGKGKEAREKFAGWRASIATAARDWQIAQGGVALMNGPLSVAVTFYMPRPASLAKRFLYPTKKPDTDKLFRLLADALTGVLIADDSMIISISAHKRFATGDRPPRAEIVVELMSALRGAA